MFRVRLVLQSVCLVRWFLTENRKMNEQKINLRFCFKPRKTPKETYAMLVRVYEGQALSLKCVYVWFTRFQEGRESVSDNPHSGRLAISVSDESNEKLSTQYIETFVIPLDKLRKPIQEIFRALHTEEAFNGLFDFRIVSKAPSGEILLQSQKQMNVTWCEIRTGGGCRRSQPRVAIWFCIAVVECGLALSFNSNRTPGLRNPDCFFRVISFNFDQDVTIPRRHGDTLVPISKKSTQ
ncbi:hypothetical protein TNCV_368591 [Trichonephila clavipes]|nr:hypothetical protein TNCV_368591 [Trichonephila clavipes]